MPRPDRGRTDEREVAVSLVGEQDRATGFSVDASDYVPFERLSPRQEHVRATVRHRLARLVARDGEILHASFTGHKPTRADVENLLLYNIDFGGRSFTAAAAHGLRFELGQPPHRDREDNSYHYAYPLVPRESPFEHWRDVRELARWDHIELDESRHGRRLRSSGSPFAPRRSRLIRWRAVLKPRSRCGCGCIRRLVCGVRSRRWSRGSLTGSSAPPSSPGRGQRP